MDLNKSFAFSEEFDLDFGDISRVEPREDDYEDEVFFKTGEELETTANNNKTIPENPDVTPPPDVYD